MHLFKKTELSLPYARNKRRCLRFPGLQCLFASSPTLSTMSLLVFSHPLCNVSPTFSNNSTPDQSSSNHMLFPSQVPFRWVSFSIIFQQCEIRFVMVSSPTCLASSLPSSLFLFGSSSFFGAIRSHTLLVMG